MILFVVSPLMTVLTNADALYFGAVSLPGLRIHDLFSAVASQAIAVLPFFLARQLLATEAAQREILLALVVAGVAYSFPMLLEVRLSPQLNTWIYGFFQHDFIQMMRGSGFRPIVFLPHALWVAFFALMAFVAAVVLWREAAPDKRGAFLLASGYLGMVLVLCKSAAVLVYAAFLVPVVRLASGRQQVRLAAALALVAVLFPLLRGADLVPVDRDARAGGGGERRARCIAQVPLRQRGRPARPGGGAPALRMGRVGPQPHLRPDRGQVGQHDRRALDHRHRHLRLVRLHRGVRAAGPADSHAGRGRRGGGPVALRRAARPDPGRQHDRHAAERHPHPLHLAARGGDARLRGGAEGGTRRGGERHDGVPEPVTRAAPEPARTRTIL